MKCCVQAVGIIVAFAAGQGVKHLCHSSQTFLVPKPQQQRCKLGGGVVRGNPSGLAMSFHSNIRPGKILVKCVMDEA